MNLLGKTEFTMKPLSKPIKAVVIFVALVVVLFYGFVLGYPPMLRWYVGDKVSDLGYPNQDTLSNAEFERVAMELEHRAVSWQIENALASESNDSYRAERARLLGSLPSIREEADYPHIHYFREAGIRTYEGAQTCLQCHETMQVMHPDGTTETVNTLNDVMNTVHYRLFSAEPDGFTTVGYDGRMVNADRPIPVGKIDRACGIPGSFTWTGWAALVEAHPEHGDPVMHSEGCGQCHIGGGYGPASEEMMPIVFRNGFQRDGIDCLICHSQTYDMNQRFVIDDGVGTRWNQDRSMQAAMTVGKPTQDGCLHCHQHNMGGDSYPFNDASHHPGYEAARLLHESAKRGTPYSPEADVHAAAGMTCLDCHTSVGHKIARGQMGVDLVSNDLPHVEVSCERCHTSAPHVANPDVRAILNGHTARIGCETCHITELWEDNIVMVDWTDPVWDPEEGLYHPRAVHRTGDMSEAVEYLWYNGTGSFLANALGTNPTGDGSYNPLMENLAVYDRVPGLEMGGIEGGNFLSPLSPEMLERRRQMVADNIAPAQERGTSRIYPFKLFNARMYEDMNNQGPFGAMILPFDYPTYYETGDAFESMKQAVSHTIIRRMYQLPFKLYMMDEFMAYFGVDGWTMEYPLDDDNIEDIQPNWMRQMGTLMLNHGIQRQGRTCAECHVPEDGILDFRRLGYSEERAVELENLPEMQMLMDAGVEMTRRAPDRHSPWLDAEH